MRANLQELAKVLRPISDERARELGQRIEAEAGIPGSEFVAAEHEMCDEFWARAEAIELAKRLPYAPPKP